MMFCFPALPSNRLLLIPALLACSLLSPVAAYALDELADDAMGSVTGEGIAIVLNDIALKASPTSFIELTGANVTGSELAYLRGDLRWYGMSYTGATGGAGQTWSGACSSGIMDMGCPIGGTIANLAPHDNPLVLRAFDYNATLYDGTVNQKRTVLELVFPTAHDPYRFAFWGELNVGTGTTRRGGTAGTAGPSQLGDGSRRLQVQNIWSNINQGGTVVRIFQHTNAADPTMGVQYINSFAADIRMSVAQTFFSPDTLGQTPEFDDTEGLYIGDYRVFFPMGQLHYQALVLDDEPGPTKNGDFVINLTGIPNTPSVYNDHYGRTIADDPTGGYNRSVQNARGTYNATHGFVRMGDWAPTHNYSMAYSTPPGFNSTNAPTTGGADEVAGCIADRPTCTKNSGTAVDDGLFFVAAPGRNFTVYTRSPNYMYDGNIDADMNANAIGGGAGTTTTLTRINLGDSRIEGMMVHSMRLTTLGAGP